MSSQPISDGGPAFPVPNDANVNGQEGMSLRDYFAARAMQEVELDVNYHLDSAARVCYEIADAMIEARKGGQQ